MYYVYILLCRDKSLYTGITTDLKRRLAEHNGIRLRQDYGVTRKSAVAKSYGVTRGAKYTRGRGPFELVYSKKFKNRSAASKEEARVKKLSRADKLLLVEGIR